MEDENRWNLLDALSRIDAAAEVLREIDAALGFTPGLPVMRHERLDEIARLRKLADA